MKLALLPEADRDIDRSSLRYAHWWRASMVSTGSVVLTGALARWLA